MYGQPWLLNKISPAPILAYFSLSCTCTIIWAFLVEYSDPSLIEDRMFIESAQGIGGRSLSISRA